MLLSVLDQSPIREGGDASQAIAESGRLARAAEALGYHRYWLAEHHGTGGLASAAPEIVIAHVAAQTSRIRVGSGGVMLTHYSALKVAEQFRTLEAMFPGRIDLGVGRAPGSNLPVARALSHGPGALSIEAYPEQVQDLVCFLADDLTEEQARQGVRATPGVPGIPEVWCLGSSLDSAHTAAVLGLPFSFAQFINPEDGPRATALYRRDFQPSESCPEPRVSVGINTICAPTEEEAVRLSWSRYCMRFTRGPVPTVEAAMAFDYSPSEREFIEYSRSRAAIGDPARVKQRIETVLEEHDADEAVLLTITYDFAARVRSYALVAEAFGLVTSAEAAEAAGAVATTA